MALFNINDLSPDEVRATLPALDGITPRVAEEIAQEMATRGPFRSVSDLLALLRRVRVNPRFFDGIARIIGVLPLFRFDDFLNPEDAEELIEKEIVSTTGDREKKKVRLDCRWRYRIRCLSRIRQVPVDFEGQALDIGLAPPPKTLVSTEGKVSFSCKEEDDRRCDPRGHEIDYEPRPPVDAVKIEYDKRDIQTALGALGGAANPNVRQISKFEARCDVRVTATNATRCFLVAITTDIKFVPTIVDIKVKGVPGTLTIGQPAFTDTFTNKYLLCCCRFQKDLEELAEGDRVQEEAEIPREEDLVGDQCGCACRFKHVRSQFQNPNAPVVWEIEAFEGGCKDRLDVRTTVEGVDVGGVRNRTDPIRVQKRDERGDKADDD